MKFSLKWLIFTVMSVLGCHVSASGLPRAEPKEISFELSRNHIFVQAQVNGKGPFSFLLDTGAGGIIIATDILDGIGAKGEMEGGAMGVGESLSQAFVLSNIRFQIGELRFSSDSVFAMSLNVMSSAEGRKVDGVMGYEFFRDHVVEIDYQRRQLRMRNPTGADSHPNTLMLTFVDKMPIIDAVLTDERNVEVRCKLAVDTGATRPLLLTSSFVAAHSDFQFPNSSIHLPLIGGAGNSSMQRITRIRKLTIGPYQFERLVTGVSESKSGLTAREGIDGMIGGQLLARFRLVLDYPQNWILFEPEIDLKHQFEYDMSGLIFFATGPDLSVYVVQYVLPNSPATEAGLQVGDVISVLDGKAASKLRGSTISAMFSKAGRTHDLIIERDGKKIRTKLKLRPLV